jgi:O-antigen/teichoic acid export membrane protein
MEQSPYARKNVRKGIFHYLMGRAFSGIAGIASVVLLARAMEVKDYAGYTALTGLAMLVGILSGLGFDRAVARYVPEGRMHYTALQLSGLVWRLGIIRFAVSIALTLTIYFIWPLITRLFANSLHMEYFPWSLACLFPSTVLFEYFLYVLQALVMQKVLTRILVIQWGGRLIIIFALFYINGIITLDQALWIMTIPEAVATMIFIFVIRSYMRNLATHNILADKDIRHWPQWPEIYKMAMYNYSYNIIVSAPQGYSMRLIAAAILPTEFVAAYGFFLTMYERIRPYLPVQLLYAIIEPTVISGYIKNNDFSRLNAQIKFMMNINMYTIILIMSIYSIFHNDLIGIALRHDYTGYDWILCILLVQLAWITNSQLMILVVNAVGKSYILLFPSLLSLIITILYLYYMIENNKEYIILAPIVFYITNNILVATTLRMSGFAYRISIFKASFFIILSIFLYELTANAHSFIATDVPTCIGDTVCLSYLQVKLLMAMATIVVSFPMLISYKDILFLKDYFITRQAQ